MVWRWLPVATEWEDTTYRAKYRDREREREYMKMRISKSIVTHLAFRHTYTQRTALAHT